MMINQYYEAGEKFDYVATGAVDYHAIVVSNDLIGVTTKAGVAGDIIACDAVGVFALKKTAGEAIAQGKKVYVKDGVITATATGATYAGISWAKAETADETCLVKINA